MMKNVFPPITSAMLVLTHACNLRCRYCFVHKEPETMTLNTAKDSVHFLVKNTKGVVVPSINFFGGEPMLCWDSIIVPLVKFIREELKVPFKLSMTTNGTLLNPERIDFMKRYNVGILFSIDGDKATQDYNRPYADGNGSFDSLCDLIPIVAKEFCPTFRMTTIPQTCSNLFHDIMFVERAGFLSFFVIPNVFEEWTDDAWKTLHGELHKYAKYFVECYRSGSEPLRFSSFEEALRQITQINTAIKCDACSERCNVIHKCGLGVNKYASIHPNGDLYACQEMTSNEGPNSIFFIGNIYSGVDEQRRVRLANMFDKTKVVGDDCSSCRLYRICNGGCAANNYMISGDINTPPQVYCKWRRLLLDEAIYVMNQLADNSRFVQEWRDKYGKK